MTMRKGVFRLALCLAIVAVLAAGAAWCSGRQPQAAASQPVTTLRTWAVLASDELRKSGLEDQIMVGLGTDRTITLVDRQHLDLVVKEMVLSRLLEARNADSRRKAGAAIRADVLVILNPEPTNGDRLVRLVICETRAGARLLVDCIPYKADKPDQAAKAILAAIKQIRRRFPQGVQRVYAVPPFVSRNLSYEYDHLQRGCASLFASALSRQDGVAVVEIDEARQIMREINLTDGKDIHRIVPLFIKGEYEVARSKQGKEAAVRFCVKVTGNGSPVNIPGRTVKLSEMAGYLSSDLPALILGGTARKRKPLTVDQQVSALVASADVFARLGAWEHSTGLREAALLLNPNDVKQRILVIQETCRIVTANWPQGTICEDGREPYESIRLRRLIRRRRALEHVEYLIRNRKVSRSVATKLVRETMGSIYIVRTTNNACNGSLLTEEERRKKEFLTNVYPLILDIPPNSKNKPGLELWQSALVGFALTRWDGNFLLKEDLDFLCKVLTTVIPYDFSPDSRVAYFLGNVPHRFKHGDRYKHYRFSPKEYLDFLSRLELSDKPSAAILAQYGRLNYEWVHIEDKNDKAALKKLLKRTEQLLAKCEVIKIKPSCIQIRRTVLHQQIRDMRCWIRRHLNPPAKTAQAQVGQVQTPRPKRSTGRLIFKEVPLRLKRLSGEVESSKGMKWCATGGWWGITRLVKCGDGLDVMWQNSAILFMRKKGLVEEVFVDKRPYFHDVRWDGRNVWISTLCDGIWIVSPTGKLLAKIGKKQGLPLSNQGLLLHPIAPGKVCAVGSFGQHRRAWCAIVDFDGQTGKVNIFHRATRVPMSGEDDKGLGGDTRLVFQPCWVHEFDMGEKNNHRILLVGRRPPCFAGRRRPLRIDLDTLDVSIFKQDLTSADNMSYQSYFSRNGRLVEGKRLLHHNGWVYGIGLAWYRINSRTWKSERLNPGRLPYKYSILDRQGYHAVSAHYGLVAWDVKGTFYSIRVKDQPLTADAAGKKEWFGIPYRVINVKQCPS